MKNDQNIQNPFVLSFIGGGFFALTGLIMMLHGNWKIALCCRLMICILFDVYSDPRNPKKACVRKYSVQGCSSTALCLFVLYQNKL